MCTCLTNEFYVVLQAKLHSEDSWVAAWDFTLLSQPHLFTTLADLVSNSKFVMQIVVGNPPSSLMEDTMMASPFGVVIAGKDWTTSHPSLSASEVKLAYSMGGWTAQISRMLHDADVDKLDTNISPPASLPIAISRSDRNTAGYAASYPH